jgi:hypothetical protein
VSKIFRTKGWLTVAQLAHSWAREVVEPRENVLHCEQNLTHELIEDILNGRFDATGPFLDGQCSGIRLITPENKAAIIDKGQELAGLAATDPIFFSHHVVLMKEAVLDFAKRRQLPQPSWWSDREEHAARQVKRQRDKPNRRRAPQQTGKRPRIIVYLAKNYPDGVPDPGIVPRKHLKKQILAWDLSLNPLDEGTLKRAIDQYNDDLSARKDDPR